MERRSTLRTSGDVKRSWIWVCKLCLPSFMINLALMLGLTFFKIKKHLKETESVYLRVVLIHFVVCFFADSSLMLCKEDF